MSAIGCRSVLTTRECCLPRDGRSPLRPSSAAGITAIQKAGASKPYTARRASRGRGDGSTRRPLGPQSLLSEDLTALRAPGVEFVSACSSRLRVRRQDVRQRVVPLVARVLEDLIALLIGLHERNLYRPRPRKRRRIVDRHLVP